MMIIRRSVYKNCGVIIDSDSSFFIFSLSFFFLFFFQSKEMDTISWCLFIHFSVLCADTKKVEHFLNRTSSRFLFLPFLWFVQKQLDVWVGWVVINRWRSGSSRLAKRWWLDSYRKERERKKKTYNLLSPFDRGAAHVSSSQCTHKTASTF